MKYILKIAILLTILVNVLAQKFTRLAIPISAHYEKLAKLSGKLTPDSTKRK